MKRILILAGLLVFALALTSVTPSGGSPGKQIQTEFQAFSAPDFQYVSVEIEAPQPTYVFQSRDSYPGTVEGLTFSQVSETGSYSYLSPHAWEMDYTKVPAYDIRI